MKFDFNYYFEKLYAFIQHKYQLEIKKGSVKGRGGERGRGRKQTEGGAIYHEISAEKRSHYSIIKLNWVRFSRQSRRPKFTMTEARFRVFFLKRKGMSFFLFERRSFKIVQSSLFVPQFSRGRIPYCSIRVVEKELTQSAKVTGQHCAKPSVLWFQLFDDELWLRFDMFQTFRWHLQTSASASTLTESTTIHMNVERENVETIIISTHEMEFYFRFKKINCTMLDVWYYTFKNRSREVHI